MGFIDYAANSPKEELKNAFFRTDSVGLNKIGSFKGRSMCVLRVVTHTSCIVLKPLYYLLNGSLGVLFTHLASKGKLKGPAFDKDPTIERIRNLENNPELKKRLYSTIKNMLLCAPVAIISQVIQVIKAVIGILHPGFYFRNDSLTLLMHRLAVVARKLGCQKRLIQELEKGSKAIEIGGANNAYIRAKYTQYLNTIATKLEDPNIPDARKLSVISLLNVDEDTDISGIKGCIAGLGRTFQDMLAMIDVPESSGKVVPFLLEKLKKDIITQMVLSAEYPKKNPGQWKDMVNKLGWDQAHRGTALTSVIGNTIGLSADVIAMVNQDPFVAVGIQLTNNEQFALLSEFNTRFAAQKMAYLLSAINSGIVEDPQGQVEVTPGLKLFRQKVIEALVSSVTLDKLTEIGLGDGDEAVYVEKIYQKNKGVGDRSETGFNDLNQQAITFLLDNPNCFTTP